MVGAYYILKLPEFFLNCMKLLCNPEFLLVEEGDKMYQ